MLKNICSHLSKIKYLNARIQSGVVDRIDMLDLGNMLLDNIKRERVKAAQDIPLNESSQIHYHNMEEFHHNFLKCEIIQETLRSRIDLLKMDKPASAMNLLDISAYKNSEIEGLQQFKISNAKILYENCLVPEQKGMEIFYKICRQRKIWWMRLASNPGGIATTTPNTKEDNQSVVIIMKNANFDIELERIDLFPLGSKLEQKEFDPYHLVQSTQCLPISTFAFLVDASLEISTSSSLMLHRKLSPYKIAIYKEQAKDEAKQNDLKDLGRLIEIICSKNGIATINLDREVSVGRKFESVDEIGVPYSVLLEESSLIAGMLKLRSRNTTLCETIHISDIPEYPLKLI